MSNVRLLVSLVFMFMFAGCSGNGAAANSGGGGDVGAPVGTAPALTLKVTVQSVPMVLDPSALPPDPGADNNKTISGVDSNGNGIRDDVERWIAQTYPQSSRMRAALAGGALSLQKELTGSFTKETAGKQLEDGVASYICIARGQIGGANREKALSAYKEMYATTINTVERVYAQKLFQKILGSGAIVLPEYSDGLCNISFISLPN